MSDQSKLIQGTLFEEGYLLRSVGPISSNPFAALTELVANAWDAGASRVAISIPPESDGNLVVEDDGTGLTRNEFRKRWMTLGYNRQLRQGEYAEFPPGREGPRRAFGRSGIGRHGLLCFADEYVVKTWKGDEGWRFTVRALDGKDPFGLIDEERIPSSAHGMTLQVQVRRNLPDPREVRDVLSVRFLHDPSFAVIVNDKSVDLTELSGFIEQQELDVEGASLKLTFVDSHRWVHRKAYHGVAFWVGNRLVGDPSWQLGNFLILDGRTTLARRFTVIVQTDDLFDLVLSDWSGFHKSETISKINEQVADVVTLFLRKALKDRAVQTKVSLLREHRASIEDLDELGRYEVSEFLDQVTAQAPSIGADALEVATTAVVNLAKSKSGRSLLAKLSDFDPDDIDALNSILDDWTIRDILIVLREIDTRLAVINAIDRLVGTDLGRKVDELTTVHPLVTQARWLFGPQFESEEYAFNVTVQRALTKLLQKRIDPDRLYNPRHRPDLIALSDATLSAVATERFTETGEVVELDRILIVEVKRADKRLSRGDINQAEGYVEDLAASGIIDGRPRIRAFVVGANLDSSLSRSPLRILGDPEFGRIEAITFDQVVRTAEHRLFKLRDRLKDRYESIPGLELVNMVLGEPTQSELEFPNDSQRS